MSLLSSSTPRIIARSLAIRTSSGAASTTTLRFRSTVDAREPENNPKGFYPVYVHHVSKIALQHLQEKRSDWLIGSGLNRGLHISPNGTFIMSFPAKKGFDSGRIWCVFSQDSKLFVFVFHVDATYIYLTYILFMLILFIFRTSYDTAKKQHWLSVYRQKLAVRFLLKDNQMLATQHHDSKITEKKIFSAVDQMISAVNQLEVKRQP